MLMFSFLLRIKTNLLLIHFYIHRDIREICCAFVAEVGRIESCTDSLRGQSWPKVPPVIWIRPLVESYPTSLF